MTQRPVSRVLLLGMMGAGKSTVGQALATVTGWPYVDNDDLVAEGTGLPVPELLATRGVAALRAAESHALSAALALKPPVIAGVAAGVVLDEHDRVRLKQEFTVYLRATVATLVRRVQAGPPRPWLTTDAKEAIQAEVESLLAVRAPLLAEVAALTVDVDDATPHEITATVLKAFQDRTAFQDG